VEVASGMLHLHKLNIIHCDLASRNILLRTILDGYLIKISDFGLSKFTETGEYQSVESAVIPVRYSSPELLSKKKFNKQNDVWSFGVLLWQFFSRKVPYFEVTSMPDLITLLCEGYRLRRPSEMPDQFWNLIESCFAKEQDRPDFEAIFLKLDAEEKRIIKEKNIEEDSFVKRKKIRTTRISFRF